MFFEYPSLLWLLVVPVLLLALYIYRELSGRVPHLRVSNAAPWLSGGPTILSVLRHLPFAFRLAALCLIIVAIARPRSSSQVEKIDTEGIDIVLAMDVSTSMLARDFTPDRISAAKDIAIEFIAQRPSDRMGIVVFAGESYTQCPLTTDRATLINLMKEVQTDLIEDGTAIGNGLATAVARMSGSDAPSRVIILLTDGVNNKIVFLAIALLCVINAGYGGGFSNLPTLLSDRFGMKSISQIHGLALSAWAFAGLTGNQLSSFIVSRTQSFTNVLYVTTILYAVALVISLVLVKPSGEKNK